jgi:uncharacterized protein YlxW (UPF0749 family)
MNQQHEQILARYGAILELNEEMLETAVAGDWEHLIEMKSAHLCQVEALMNVEHQIEVTEAFRAAKRAVLVQIAAKEQQLRERLQERMAQLSGAISQARSTQRVKHAYERSAAL